MILHDFFDVSLCLLTVFSLLEYIDESYLLIYAMGYFIVDLVYCLVRKDATFT